MQKRRIVLDDAAGRASEPFVVGGSEGRSLGEAAFTREKLEGLGYSEEEAEKALPFLRGVRYMGHDAVFPSFLHEAVAGNTAKTAAGLRRNIINALFANNAVSYNLSSAEGLDSFIDGAKAGNVNISKNEIRALLAEEQNQFAGSVSLPPYMSSAVRPRYRSVASAVPAERVAPRGTPEKIRLVENLFRRNDFSGFSSGSFNAPEIFDFEAVSNAGVSYNNISAMTDNNASFSEEVGDSNRSLLFPKVNGETGRHKKIEANYEKDKKLLAKKEIPVLARSEPHDVGHAVGVRDEENFGNIVKMQRKELIKELTNRKRR